MPAVGEKAPDFELVSDEGKKVRLSSFLGRKVILYFFPKAGTSG
jgi:peroxiredoxin Q/BCP